MALNTSIGPERVQVLPQPLGTVQVPGASTSVCAFLIASSQGSENIATKVTNLDAFVEIFGGPDEVTYDGYYAVKGYFDNGGTGKTAWIVNVGAAPTALDYIGDAADGTGLRALDTLDELGLVCAPGVPLAMSAAVQKAVIDYSETVRAEFGATLSTTFSLLAIPKEILEADLDDIYYTHTLLANLAANNLTVVGHSATAGSIVLVSGSPVAYVTSIAGDTINFNQVVTQSAGTVLSFATPSAVNYKEFMINNPSKTAAWYFNPVVVLDEAITANPGDLLTIDPVGHIAGVMGRIDSNRSIGGVSHAPAGIQYGAISGIVGLYLSLSERVDAEPLRLNFINRLQSFPGAGYVIFGGYTAESGTSPLFTADEQLIQVIRSVQFIKASLEPGLRAFLWENFSPETQNQVGRAIESFLRNNIYLFPAGLPEAQQFKVIKVEATQEDLDQGLLKVRVQIKPNKAVRFIEVALEFPLPTA